MPGGNWEALIKVRLDDSTVDADVARIIKQIESAYSNKSSKNNPFEGIAKGAREAAKSTSDYKNELTQIRSVTLSNKIQTWMNNNSKAADRFGAVLREMQNQLNSGKLDGDAYRRLSLQFAQIQSEARAAGLTVNSFATSLKNVGLQVLGIGSAYQVAMKIINTVKQGVNTVVELDTALVDLRKTTTMSDNDLAEFYREANIEAKALGVSTKEIITQAAQWSRLGYSSKQDATMMARLSSQFAMISPGMSVDTATTGLVSIMKAYGIQTDEVLDGVMSKINRIGNTAATNNAEIIQGLQNSASALAAMNTDLDKSIALFTAGQEIAQDAPKVGNALRSISLRIRGYDEETEQLSDDLVNISGAVVDLTKTTAHPLGVSLFTDETQTQYKDVYEYLEDIAEIWADFDKEGRAAQKQELMEKLFGKNRANIGLAIVQNFAAAKKAMDEMANSAGDADREMSIIMDELQYKLNALKQTGVGIWQNLFPRETIGNAIDGLTAFADVLEKITGFLGPGGTLVAAIGTGGIIKSIS